jgi:predicted Zn-dependent peptidase
LLSFRFVVRAGGAEDPDEMRGLAHLLEHLIFHGSYDVEGRPFDDRVRAAGGRMNAYTTPDSTTYVLDVPRDRAQPLVVDFLHMITSPALELSRLDRELDVVTAEAEFRSANSILWAVDQMLFPGKNQGARLIGSEASRARIGVAALQAFFAKHYRPTRSTVVLVGDVDDALVQAVTLESRLPPQSTSEGDAPTADAPSLPVEAKVRAPETLSLFGYAFAGTAPQCRDTADVLTRRLHRRVVIAEPIVASVEVLCVSLRGTLFLFAIAHAASYDAAALPSLFGEVFLDFAKRGADARELLSLAKRQRARERLLSSDPEALASALAERAALRAGDVDATDVSVLFAVPTRAEDMRRAAQKSFIPQNQVLLHLSPFEG